MTNLGLAALAMGLEALWALAAVAADTGQGRARQSHSPATTASVPPPPISSRLHRQEHHGALNALGLLPASVALRAIPNAAAAHHRVGVQAMVRGGASILKGPWFVAKWIWSSQTHWQGWMLKSQNHHHHQDHHRHQDQEMD